MRQTTNSDAPGQGGFPSFQWVKWLLALAGILVVAVVVAGVLEDSSFTFFRKWQRSPFINWGGIGVALAMSVFVGVVYYQSHRLGRGLRASAHPLFWPPLLFLGCLAIPAATWLNSSVMEGRLFTPSAWVGGEDDTTSGGSASARNGSPEAVAAAFLEQSVRAAGVDDREEARVVAVVERVFDAQAPAAREETGGAAQMLARHMESIRERGAMSAEEIVVFLREGAEAGRPAVLRLRAEARYFGYFREFGRDRAAALAEMGRLPREEAAKGFYRVAVSMGMGEPDESVRVAHEAAVRGHATAMGMYLVMARYGVPGIRPWMTAQEGDAWFAEQRSRQGLDAEAVREVRAVVGQAEALAREGETRRLRDEKAAQDRLDTERRLGNVLSRLERMSVSRISGPPAIPGIRESLRSPARLARFNREIEQWMALPAVHIQNEMDRWNEVWTPVLPDLRNPAYANLPVWTSLDRENARFNTELKAEGDRIRGMQARLRADVREFNEQLERARRAMR